MFHYTGDLYIRWSTKCRCILTTTSGPLVDYHQWPTGGPLHATTFGGPPWAHFPMHAGVTSRWSTSEPPDVQVACVYMISLMLWFVLLFLESIHNASKIVQVQAILHTCMMMLNESHCGCKLLACCLVRIVSK